MFYICLNIHASSSMLLHCQTCISNGYLNLNSSDIISKKSFYQRRPLDLYRAITKIQLLSPPPPFLNGVHSSAYAKNNRTPGYKQDLASSVVSHWNKTCINTCTGSACQYLMFIVVRIHKYRHMAPTAELLLSS